MSTSECHENDNEVEWERSVQEQNKFTDWEIYNQI